MCSTSHAGIYRGRPFLSSGAEISRGTAASAAAARYSAMRAGSVMLYCVGGEATDSEEKLRER